MIPAYLIWLAVVIAFGIAEAATLGLTSIWFAVGALAAMVSAICHAPWWLQIGVFVVISVAALCLTRKKAQARFNQSREKTNADRILGEKALVLEPIDNQQALGAVKADGKVWTARSISGEPIPRGIEVTVRAIEGVKLMVEPAE